MTEADDPVAAMQAQKRRGALLMLAGMGVFVAIVVVAMALLSRDMANPSQALATFDLTTTPTEHSFETSTAGSVVLWVEVEQGREGGFNSGNPSQAADVVVVYEGQEQRCSTTDVLSFGVLNRTASRDSWRGQLSGCKLGHVTPGQHRLKVFWVPAGNTKIEVQRVKLTPSLQR